MRHTLLLFDIDGTLVHGRGVGVRAMEQAGRALFGESFTFEGVQFGGGLDNILFTEAAVISGLANPDDHHDAFRDEYLRTLEATLATPGHPLTPTPGAIELIHHLRQRQRDHADIVLGMVTGNYREGAELKLRAAGIDIAWFTVTAFGHEADTRPGLVELAMRRYREAHAADPDPQRIIVIGDTPRDVQCAKAHDCYAYAVATGKFSADALRAAGADHVALDLSDPTPLLKLLDR